MEGIGPMPQKYQCQKGLGGCAVEPEPEPRIPKRTNVKRQSRQMAKAPKSPKSAESGLASILIFGFANTAAKSAPKASKQNIGKKESGMKSVMKHFNKASAKKGSGMKSVMKR